MTMEAKTFADKVRAYAATGVPITMDAGLLLRLARMSEQASAAREEAKGHLIKAQRLLTNAIATLMLAVAFCGAGFVFWVMS